MIFLKMTEKSLIYFHTGNLNTSQLQKKSMNNLKNGQKKFLLILVFNLKHIDNLDLEMSCLTKAESPMNLLNIK